MNAGDDLIGALACCGVFTIVGGTIWLVCLDTGATERTCRFWRLWTIFWFMPIAIRVLMTVLLG